MLLWLRTNYTPSQIGRAYFRVEVTFAIMFAVTHAIVALVVMTGEESGPIATRLDAMVDILRGSVSVETHTLLAEWLPLSMVPSAADVSKDIFDTNPQMSESGAFTEFLRSYMWEWMVACSIPHYMCHSAHVRAVALTSVLASALYAAIHTEDRQLQRILQALPFALLVGEASGYIIERRMRGDFVNACLMKKQSAACGEHPKHCCTHSCGANTTGSRFVVVPPPEAATRMEGSSVRTF